MNIDIKKTFTFKCDIEEFVKNVNQGKQGVSSTGYTLKNNQKLKEFVRSFDKHFSSNPFKEDKNIVSFLTPYLIGLFGEPHFVHHNNSSIPEPEYIWVFCYKYHNFFISNEDIFTVHKKYGVDQTACKITEDFILSLFELIISNKDMFSIELKNDLIPLKSFDIISPFFIRKSVIEF